MEKIKKNGKWGFIDKKGKEIIPCRYDNVFIFKYRLVIVILNDKWGLTDKTGKEITPCKYDNIDLFENGLAQVVINEKYGIIDKTGKEITPCKYDNYFFFKNTNIYKTINDYFFKIKLVGVELDGKWGAIDKAGKEIIPIGKYIQIGNFYHGMARVVRKGEPKIINEADKEIIPFEYGNDFVKYKIGLPKSVINEMENKKYGFIDRTGKEVIPCEYDDIGYYRYFDNNDYFGEDGLLKVKLNGKWGFVDKKGKEVIPCKYDNVFIFKSGLFGVKIFQVELDGKYSYINKKGKEIIKKEYNKYNTF